jgi:hypothetical protein
MFLHSQHDQDMRTMRALALSTSQVQSRTSDNNLLLSKPEGGNLVNLFEVDSDTTYDPTQITFTSCSQLSDHLAIKTTNRSENGKRLGIL